MVIPQMNCSIPFFLKIPGFQTFACVHSHNHNLLCAHYFCEGYCARGCDSERICPISGEIQSAVRAHHQEWGA